ncbi:hypothetical protein RB653_010244 [Dictyostelium firmibasis]|uniref:Uncharacterized protein n=1 Tax=Dictyostelium firmibasis TaxID=79012 RepID=A0AAN7TLI2_9MYCE
MMINIKQVLKNILFILFITINCKILNASQPLNKINSKDSCFSYIPKTIIEKVSLLKPDQGGLRDVIIRSIPEQFSNNNNDNNNSNNINNTLYFLLKDLEPNTQYALRISYPASSPTDYKIKFFDNPLITTEVLTKFKLNDEKPKSRDLLNTEIIKFKTDSSSYVMESYEFNRIKHNPCSIITIDAINVAITPSFVKNDGFKYQSFDLIMDTEILGVPPEIPKLVIIIVSTILVVFFAVKKYITL